MKNPLTYLFLIIIVLGNSVLLAAQTPSEEIKTGKMLKREVVNEVDNYVYATFSFKFGGNGPEVQKLCRNNWDILFGNSVLDDGFDVTMGGDDRSRMKDLGRYKWEQLSYVPRLSAFEEPDRQEALKAILGHIYLVHIRDRDYNHYALFRVDRLISGESVDISWKLISPPTGPW